MAYDEGMGLMVPGQGFTKIAADGQGDLQKALGRTTCYSEIQLIGDVDANGNRVGATNKWAKFKPFQYSGVFADSGPGSSRETAMRAANFGLSVPTFTYSNLVSKFNKATPDIADVRWVYTPPTTYYRAEDFLGYVSRCDAWQLGQSTASVLYGPFGLTLTLPSTTIGNNDVITLSMFKDSIDYLVHLDEFQNLTYTFSDWYIGVLFAPTDGSSYYALYSTGEKPSATDWQYFEIPIDNNLHNTTYYNIVPVLIQTPSASGAGYRGTSGQLCTFDDAYLPNIQKVATSNNLIVSLTKTVTSAGRVSGSIKITNNTGTRINVQDLFLYLEAEQIVDGMESYGLEYHNKILDTVDAWVGSSHTRETSGIMGNGSDSSKIIARYLNVSSSAFYVGVGPSNAVTKTFDFGSSATSDGLGHTYNNFSIIYTQMRYTPDGGTSVYRTF